MAGVWSLRAVLLDVAESVDSGYEGDLEEIWVPVLQQLGELLQQRA